MTTSSGPEPAPLGFGVIGARSFVAARAVLPAIDEAPCARLVAAASLGGPVPDRWRSRAVSSYEDVLDHPEVDAVYIPLPNSMHHEWVLRAAAAGKHVLCEKPLATDPTTAAAMAHACRDAGVVLAEAWMTPFDPRWIAALDLAREGVVGDLVSVESTFTFTIPSSERTNYRWDPVLGGGALLDVGIYCLGAPTELWDAEPIVLTADRDTAPSGVDATTRFELAWPDGRRATGRCSFIESEAQELVLTGAGGAIVLDGDAFTGGTAARSITVEYANGRCDLVEVESDDPYRRMIEAFTATVTGRAPWPRPVERSIALLGLLDRIARWSRP
ncbi:MAG: Gfo/Idh/MocA family protein [Ilumatobacteraceae bacterium]